MASRGVNKVILIGYLGQDPDIRYMPNGNAVTNFNIATSDIWKDKNTGDAKEKTEWHKIVLFGKLAEISAKYLKKGSQVYIEGSLQTRKWKDQNGIDRYTTEVLVSITGTMQMLGNRNINNFNNTDSLKKSKNTNSFELNNIDDDITKKVTPKISKNESELEDISSKIDFDDDDIPF